MPAPSVYFNPPGAPATIISKSLDLLGLNIAHARGKALNQLLVSYSGHRRNLDALATLLASTNPHVAAVQEADGSSLWSGRFDHVEYLAAQSGLNAYIHGRHATSWLYAYGAALLSRVRLTEATSHWFEPSWPTTTKGYVQADVRWQPGGEGGSVKTVTLVSVHLDFSRKSVRRSQIAELVEAFGGSTRPLIILGDFNADWKSPDSTVRVLARELSLSAYRPDQAGLGTYKEAERLDWILISEEFEFLDYTVLPDVVSDHKAVFARVIWKEEE